MRVSSDQALRSEIQAAVTASMRKLGSAGFCKQTIVKRFLGRGTARSTIYRWIDATLASGAPGQAEARAIREAVAIRAARVSDPIAEVIEEMIVHLPALVRLEDVCGTGTVKVIEKLANVIHDLDTLVAYAKDGNGGIRDPRLMLQACDRIRACIETALKIHRVMRDFDGIEKMHTAILEEITMEAPEVAERILRRIGAIAPRWAG
jgi:hypothetical protein